ncbi:MULTISPECIES: hypothetical protein [Pandoraea]|uniref:hypothetical protein n=1 Tax=Pandoraea TaxID=93217 RepID=UPI001F5CB6CD|nr:MULTISPECIES: hypothetical protein [Pandoraea]
MRKNAKVMIGIFFLIVTSFVGVNFNSVFAVEELSIFDGRENRNVRMCIPSDFGPAVGDSHVTITTIYPSMAAAPANGVIGNDRIRLNFLGRYRRGYGLELSLINDPNAKLVGDAPVDGIREFVLRAPQGGVTEYFAFKSSDGRNVLFVDGDANLAAFSYFTTFDSGVYVRGSVSKGINKNFRDLDVFIKNFVDKMICK